MNPADQTADLGILGIGTKPAPRPVLEVLREQEGTLYAILDAAQEQDILRMLRESGEEYQSLYEGKAQEELGNVAPYLVRLPKDSPLLEELVREGWGKNWGIYLTSPQPFAEVRKHFRHFLLVKLEDGKEVYFRFYDPRVLRVFLPTCDSKERAAIFGGIAAYLVESEAGEPLHLVRSGGAGSAAR